MIGAGELVVQGTRYQAEVHGAVLRIISRPSGIGTIFFELTGEQTAEIGETVGPDTYRIPIRVTLETRELAGVLPADLKALDIERRAWSDEDPDDPDFEPNGTFYANAEHAAPLDIDLKIAERAGKRGRARFAVRNEDERLRLSVETALDIEILTLADAIAQGTETGTLDLEDWDLGPGDLEALPATDRIRNLRLGHNERLTDAGLAPLARLSGVEELFLYQTPLAGDGLAAIAGWTSLAKINLFATDIGDAAAPHLARLSGLRHLDIRMTKMTDAGFLQLAPLRGLDTVALGDTHGIGDGGLAALAGASELKYLSINGLKISERGIAALGVLPKLWQLNVDGSSIDDAAVAVMAGNFPRLAHLDASRTGLTDKALDHAARIAGLERLVVQDAMTTREGRARLRAAKPGIAVIPWD